MFLPQFFSITTTCALKCRLKFNPQLGTHLRRTCGSACGVKSKDEVCISLPDFYPNRWGCEVSVTYQHLEGKLGRLDLKRFQYLDLCGLDYRIFPSLLLCVFHNFFFPVMPLHEKKNTKCWICVLWGNAFICHIYIKHICYSQDPPEIIKELSLISLKALCWKDNFTVNTMAK